MTRPGSVADLTEKISAVSSSYLDLFTAVTDADFEVAFDHILEKAIENLETNSKNYNNLNEEGLSAVLAAGLTIPGVHVAQESNSNGHVDITIHIQSCQKQRKKLAEAKIYNGKSNHIKGLQQLLRYTTGRECRGLLLVYVKKKDVAGIMSTLRKDMDTENPANQKGQTIGDNLQWSFLSVHQHSSGKDIEVSHVGINLFTSKRDAL